MHDENKEQKRRDLKTLRLSRFVKGRLDLLGNLVISSPLRGVGVIRSRKKNQR